MGKLWNQLKKWSGINELRTLNFYRALLAEAVASGIYVFIAAGQLVPMNGADKQISRLHGALTTALSVACIASAFWEISGGHFNPAVSLTLMILRKISPVRFIFYVVAQCLGSAGGAALLYAVTPPKFRPSDAQGVLGSIFVHEEVGSGMAVVIEVVLTYQFIFVVISSTDPIRNMNGFQAPFAIGLSVGIGLLMGVPFSGGALNPIRVFGPAVVMGKLEHHWVYWVGDMLGAALAALTYEFVFTLKIDDQDKEEDVNKSRKHRRHHRDLEYSVRSESAELENYEDSVIGNKMTAMT
ncbi:lens fiber major intrinsic protein-like [Clytia hemisphaerica]|uniref:Aquaporin n=1 Tax=Clytia hemisphaerica TaxID=252671 RepID=A0A7M5WJY5_9CNID|eukprot:TCONS_00008634-protein